MHKLNVILTIGIVMGAAGSASAQIITPVINEINQGEGGPAPQVGPFVELFFDDIRVEGAYDLTNHHLRTADDSTSIPLSGSIQPFGYYVVCDNAALPVANCNQVSADIATIVADPAFKFVFDDGVAPASTLHQVDFNNTTEYIPDPLDRSGVTTGLVPDGQTIVEVGPIFRLMCPSPGASNTSPSMFNCGVVVNEVDYDQGDTDNARFVELLVYDDEGVNFTCAELRFSDSSGTETIFYFPEDFSGPPTGFTLPVTGDYIVICDDKAATPNCDWEFSESELGCGTSNVSFSDDAAFGIGFFTGRGGNLDSMSYVDTVDGYTEPKGGNPVPSDLASPGPISVSRTPNGLDTDSNEDDYVVACSTPGAPNESDLSNCELCGTGVVEGDEECDEGATENTATCEVDCTAPACGDGIWNVAADEECDASDPNFPADLGFCTDECVFEFAFTRGSGGCGNGCNNYTGSGGGLGSLLFVAALLFAGRSRRRRREGN